MAPIDRIKASIIQASLDAARNLTQTATRLERAAKAQDFSAIAEISLSNTVWPLDTIRGAALAVTRILDGGTRP